MKKYRCKQNISLLIKGRLYEVEPEIQYAYVVFKVKLGTTLTANLSRYEFAEYFTTSFKYGK